MARAALTRLVAAPALASPGPASHRWRHTSRRALLLAIFSLFLAAAQPAHAGVQGLSSASLSILIDGLPTTVAWSGTGSANVDAEAKSITGLSAGIFSFTASLDLTTHPGAFPIAGLLIPSATNGTGDFFGVDTMAGGGSMALKGFAKACLFAACDASPAENVTVPFTSDDVNGIGLGGSPVIARSDLGNFTVGGNSWTIRKPLTGGTVELETRTLISTDISAPAITIPSFAVMTLTFIPEPGTMLLLGLGLAGLTLHRRRFHG
jgi:hypothetical protein